MKETFIGLLKSTNREGIDKLIEWLETTDFYTAPASTRFHGNYEGGLLEHSLNVCNALINLSKCTAFSNFEESTLSEDTIIIASLLHDLCKANIYVPEWRNKKVYCDKGSKKDEGGKFDWQTVQGYTIEDAFPFGHGEKSVHIILSLGMKLTEKEIYMIRWHMGGFENIGNYNTLSAAMTICPEIALMHSADLIATHIIENKVTANDES